MSDFFVPENPQTKNYDIKNNTHGIPVDEFPVSWPFAHKYCQRYNSEQIGEMKNDDPGRNEPEFVFPRTGEKDHKQCKLDKLFQSRAAAVH